MSNSTRKKQRNKPAKPHPAFPLFPHANGQWAKKVRGKTHYFGPWEDPDAALTKWLDDKDELTSGRTPRAEKPDTLTLKELADAFLTSKRHLLDTGELSPRTYKDYFEVCQRAADILGKNRLVSDLTTNDFEELRTRFAKTHGAYRLGKDVLITRMTFKYGYDAGMIDTPVRFGPSFKAPTRKNLRKARRENGRKDFDAAEVRMILDAVSGVEVESARIDAETGEPIRVKLTPSPAMRAMVLLGVNCGFGQSDCANLPQSAVDLESGWIDYPRPKTEIDRRSPLWPETVAAMREATADRPRPKSKANADCVFLTKYGNRWVRMSKNESPEKRTNLDSVAQEFRKVMKAVGLNGRRNFYSLRHTFETVGGESRDQVAVDRIMGHSDDSMAANYRHRISDARLIDVVNIVREWLWPDAESAGDSEAGEGQ